MSSRHERSSPGADWDETGRPEETDGENPEGSIGQDGSKCVKQDETSLSPTSSTPKVRSSTASRRTPFRRHQEPGEPANAGARQAELVRTLGIVVLAALMGLTSWVVASISTWLVPVYVTAMVLIFVIPQVQHLEEPEPAGEPAGERADRASEVNSPASSGPDSLAQQPWKRTVHPKLRSRALSHPVPRPQSAGTPGAKVENRSSQGPNRPSLLHLRPGSELARASSSGPIPGSRVCFGTSTSRHVRSRRGFDRGEALRQIWSRRPIRQPSQPRLMFPSGRTSASLNRALNMRLPPRSQRRLRIRNRVRPSSPLC